MYYKAPIFKNVYINKNDMSIYLNGTKVCQGQNDYVLFIDYLSYMNKNLQNNRNVEERSSFYFSVTLAKLEEYGNYSDCPFEKSIKVDINISLSIVQKKSKKSLCIILNNFKYYISKIDLDVFIFQLQKFNGERKGRHSFIGQGLMDSDEDFLISIGALIPCSASIVSDKLGDKHA